MREIALCAFRNSHQFKENTNVIFLQIIIQTFIHNFGDFISHHGWPVLPFNHAHRDMSGTKTGNIGLFFQVF